MKAQDTDPFRTQLHGMWASVAGSWKEHADFVDARSAAATETILDLAALRPGDRVLELACGRRSRAGRGRASRRAARWCSPTWLAR